MSVDLTDTKPRHGQARARPIRVAFLVPRQCSHRYLDAIFANSYGRWGGRFSPIIPCEQGKIAHAYWDWLKASDPDVIYSFEPLTADEQLRIHREIYPSELILHEHDRDDRHPVRVGIRTRLLPSLSTLLRPTRRIPITTEPPKLFDVHRRGEEARALTDSFGAYDSSATHRYPFPPEWNHLARSLTLTTAEVRDHPRSAPKGDVVVEIADAWLALAKRDTITMAECASQQATRLSFRDERWGTSFNLVVGDSEADRILFWNIRQMMPDWTDGYLGAARVGTSDFDDPAILAGIAEFLRWRNHINEGSGGQSTVTLRSVSLGADTLDALKAKLLAALKHFLVWSKPCASIDELLPTRKTLAHATLDGSTYFDRTRWKQFTWVGELAHPSIDEPTHIGRMSGPPQLVEGCWAADIELEIGDNQSQYSNVNHIWRLSRRLRMVNAFKCSFHDVANIQIAMPRRVSQGGLLCAFPSRGFELATIEPPTNQSAFHWALVADGAGARERDGYAYPAPPLGYYRSSDKGRYLRGLLGLFGGLTEAANFLLHPFWAAQLDYWGATTNAKQGDLSRIEATLRKRLNKGFSGTDGEFERLAKVVAAEARNIQLPRNAISYSELEEHWRAHRSEFWKANQKPEKPEDEERDWDAYEQATLDHALQALALSDAVFQGFVHSCAHCHHKDWVSISALSKQVECSVCGTASPAPVRLDWQFRLNDFVRDALKQHGLQSVVWCLASLRGRSRTSFYYEVQSDVWYRSSDIRAPHDAEFDLLAVVDGVSYLCEIKSQKEFLKADEHSKLIKLAEALRPDVVLIAVMDDFKNKEQVRKELQPKLGALDVTLELWSLKDHELEPSPYLR